MNILITSCSKKVSLVRSFKTYLNNRGGLLYATDINIHSPALYFADDYFLCPRSNDPKFIEFLLHHCKKFNIKLIIPTRCRELKLFAMHKHKFKDIGCEVMVCSPKSIDICQNKEKFIKFCLHHKIPVPITYSDKDLITNFPVFSKPISGSAGKGIQKINNMKELNKVNSNESLIQEWIDWKEYTIDYLSDFNGNYINCIARERLNIIHGESYVSQVYTNKNISELCKKLGRELKLIGHNTIQCFCNGSDIRFIEINPRFGGAGNLGIHAGLDSPKILIDLLYKKKINVSEFKDKLLMLRYSTDMFGYIKNNTFVPVELNQKNKTYCIDIDGTLCTEQCEYKDALPIIKVIKKINKLYKSGNKIILFTSRGYTSKKDWRPLTEDQLKKWNVKYHELHFGKPFADFYIDNKAIHILQWI